MIYVRKYSKLIAIISGEPGDYRLTVFKRKKINNRRLIIYQADSGCRKRLKYQIHQLRKGNIRNYYEKFGKKGEIILKIGLNECTFI